MLTTEALSAELMNETMLAADKGFTLTKPLGTLLTARAGTGAPYSASPAAARTEIEMNAAAVRMLGTRFPALKITYPQTVISEKTVHTGTEPIYYTETRTDAVIEVPEDFVQNHSGTAFRQLLQNDWLPQLGDLTVQIANRLRKHELRTARMFGDDAQAAAASFRLTDDTAESDIWVIPLSRCGFYPLQWDGEICGMALMLAERLKEALAQDCGTLLETAVRRSETKRSCTVTLYYSIKD